MPQVPQPLIRERGGTAAGRRRAALRGFLAAEIGRRRAVLVERASGAPSTPWR
jgi:hypothetical protein